MAGSRRDGAATRRRILAVAEDLFAAQGFDGARVDEIARQAGVNKALIYHYFKSKDEILRVLLADFIERMLERSKAAAGKMSQLVSGAAADEDLRAMLEFLEGNEKILRVMMMESVKKNVRTPLLFKTLDASLDLYRGAGPLLREMRRQGIRLERDLRLALVNEFFTRSLPAIFFVLFCRSWAEHFGVKREDLKEWFIRALAATHVAYHRAAK